MPVQGSYSSDMGIREAMLRCECFGRKQERKSDMKIATLLSAILFALIGRFGGNRDKKTRTRREYWDMAAMYAIALGMLVLWFVVMWTL